MDKKSTTELLKKHWKSIDEFDRKYSETGDPNYLVQLKLLKKQCLEILKKYYEKSF